ncbi:MAG: agmatinase [Spirochaetales bacterium]|nr:agmatinase [Spirochaetales bacterium]
MKKHFLEPEIPQPREEDSRIVILPVPYDGTSTWIKGADKGPAAIIDASPHLEFYDIITDSEVYQQGIHTRWADLDFSSPENMVASVRHQVADIIKAGRFPVVLGGEHSVTIGAAQAAAGHFHGLSFLQLDAHSDLRSKYEGSIYNHACVMARLQELGPIVQAGIRSMDSSEKTNMDKSRVFFAHTIKQNPYWQDELISKLGDQVYVTIDLDAFDPSLLPSTGTPEPGGLFWDDVISLFQKMVKHKKVVAFDVVELCPQQERVSDFVAAKLVYQFLSLIFSEESDS